MNDWSDLVLSQLTTERRLRPANSRMKGNARPPRGGKDSPPVRGECAAGGDDPRVYQRADAQDLTEIEQLNELMTSLVMTRYVLAKLPTWPWETTTLAGFVSVFVAPFIIGLVVLLLEHFLF